MKKYIAPQIICVDLRAEERIAGDCYIGECHDNGTPVWAEPGS